VPVTELRQSNEESRSLSPAEALAVVDWRRQVHALYAQVRATSDAGQVEEAHAHWRSVRDDLFGSHPASPVLDRDAFAGLPTAPYDPRWRLMTELEPGDGHRIVVATGTDGKVELVRVGTVDLDRVGRLDVWWHAGYGGGLFLPVRDALAGSRTYGGGRYLLDTGKGADLGVEGTRIVVDLNFAYNPSCAYDPSWACPLAQPGNGTDVEVPVGELMS
jgi:uncharacterized protein (DUF1684 family)